jgi:hypothetical protein
MPNTIIDGLSLVDTTGRLILAATVASLLAAVAAHLFLRMRYADLESDLTESGAQGQQFSSAVLRRIVQDAERAARRSSEPNTQAIIEDGFRADLGSLLVAERFVRAATGLVLILGLLGTFYGLTMSIGRLVHLLAGDSGGVTDVSQAVTRGLTDALSGMAVAFSNSLLGVGSAVALTVLGVVNNVTDRRTALMVQIETYLDRLLPKTGVGSHGAADSVADFGASVARLEGAVVRFETALQRFAANTKNLREVQLVVALKPGDPNQS